MLTPEQIKIRKKGITGSEIAAILGVHPYITDLQVWAKKTGAIGEQKVNSHMERGIYMGPGIARWYGERKNKEVLYYGDNERTFVHPKYPIVIATPDGIVPDENTLEIKCPSRHTEHQWGESGTDEIPSCYIPQVYWQMAATGLHAADVAAVINDDLNIYPISWDEGLFGIMLERAQRWWRDYVIANKMPPPQAEDTETIAKLFPKSQPKYIDATEEIIELAKEKVQLSEAKKEIENKEETIKNKLKMILGEHEGCKGEWGSIYYRNASPRNIIDWEAITKELKPSSDLLAKFTYVRDGARSLRIFLK